MKWFRIGDGGWGGGFYRLNHLHQRDQVAREEIQVVAAHTVDTTSGLRVDEYLAA